ncbi:MAG TPA: LptA/OstA family protein [Gammaproteobacteria bacterium]|nr:LptA/OstA family protein [Gammaproteobacteria bacterium]
MDSSYLKPALAAAWLLLAGTGLAYGQKLVAPSGIELAADSVTYDGGTSQADFRGVKISQNGLHIAADRATAKGLDTANSDWQLHGDVRIEFGSAKIASREAHLTVKSNKLATVELLGNPATFEEPGKNEQAVRGGAERLFFDNAERSLTLTGKAWLKIGTSEISGCDLVYDLAKQTFSSGTNCKEPVRIRVSPGKQEADKTAPGTAPPAEGSTPPKAGELASPGAGQAASPQTNIPASSPPGDQAQ